MDSGCDKRIVFIERLAPTKQSITCLSVKSLLYFNGLVLILIFPLLLHHPLLNNHLKVCFSKFPYF